MGELVSLIRTSNIEEIKNSIYKILNTINFNKAQVSSVTIKPNLCNYWPSSTGYTTDPMVVAGIIDIIRERYGKSIPMRIVESDASAMRTKYAFSALGYEKLSREKEVELFNLSKDRVVEREVKVNNRKINLKIPSSLLNTDLFINVPKLKIMRETHITCALKNIFGCIALPRKSIYHPYLHETIVGINKILCPNLTIVDGLVALGRCPVKLDLIMGSKDPFSIDWIASQIMGYNPSRIKILRIAIKEKLGDPAGIEICGDELNSFKSEFPKVSNSIPKLSWKIQLALINIYEKIVNDITPPELD